MADKLDKLKSMAELAAVFGGTPESEMRNRLLEAQIQAGREQTQAMRHQTQGGMMKSMMDMQKMQGDLQLNPLRREALGAEISSHQNRIAMSQAANVRANELHVLQKRGQEEIILGQKTGNAQQITRGEEMVRKAALEEDKLRNDVAAQKSTMVEWEANKGLRDQSRETAMLVDKAKREGIPSSQIGAYLSQIGPSLPNLPPAFREIAGTGLQELDPFKRTPDTAPPFSKRIGGSMTSPKEDAQGKLADANILMWIREALASDKSGLTKEEREQHQKQTQEILKKRLNAAQNEYDSLQLTVPPSNK